MAAPLEPIDVLGLGCAAVDDVLYVATYPARDGKAAVQRRLRRFGGLTGAALVAAARLGARCAYAGQLGADALSAAVRENFLSEGIDVSHAPCSESARVVHSTIVVAQDDGSRAIFYECDGPIGPHPNLPQEDCIRASTVLLIDHYGAAGAIRAAQIARAAGIGVVADFEDDRDERFGELLGTVDHLILNAAFAQRITGRPNPGEAAAALWRPDRAAVIVTCGANGCWSVDPQNTRPAHHPAVPVKATDTTGCGDVFHGAYAAALACKAPLVARIRFASAAAAYLASHSTFPRLADIASNQAR